MARSLGTASTRLQSLPAGGGHLRARALERRPRACYALPMSTNLITVVVFGAMWVALAGFFFVVVRFILVNQAKPGPGEAANVDAANAEGDQAEASPEDVRDFEFGL